MDAPIRSLFQRLGIRTASKRLAYFAGGAILAAYALIALRGPQGVPALLDKYREIRQLEEQNAVMTIENQRRRERIERLQSSTSEQEMEIRKQLKLLRPGETTFILPDGGRDATKDGGTSTPASTDSAPAVTPPQ